MRQGDAKQDAASASKLSLSTQQCASVQEARSTSMVSSRSDRCHRPVPVTVVLFHRQGSWRQRYTQQAPSSTSLQLEFRVSPRPLRQHLARIIHAVEQNTVVPCADTALCRSDCRDLHPAVFHLAVAVVASTMDHGLDLDAGCLQGLGVVGVACPCALVISTPVTVVSGFGSRGKAGI